MREKPPIIWIEADRLPARYFLNSINIHQELFPNRRKIVVTNSRFAREYRKYPVEIIEIESVKPSNLTIKFESISKKWTHNRQQLIYWKNTTKRFFHLYDALLSLAMRSCIHLESDNILFDISYLDSILRSGFNKISYPKQADGVGCASVLLIGNLNAFSEFLKYICANWQKIDSTDMTLLGEFEVKNKLAEYLPSGDKEELHEQVLFDAGTIGHYFLGGEARNYRFPSSRRGLIDRSKGSFSPQYFKICLDKYGKPILKNNINNKILKLQNVHVHSKRIPNSTLRLIHLLEKESSTSRNLFWRTGKLDLLVSFERFFSFTNRKILQRKIDVRFR